MEAVLIGSAALSEVLPNFYRPARDYDFFLLDGTVNVPARPGKKSEGFYHPKLQEYAWSGNVASLDEVYTIKVSHLFWDLQNGSWEKHYNDIRFLQARTEAKLIPELYNILYPIWEERYGKKKVNLEQSPEMFFNGNVKRVYQHDSIHDSVAYYDKPLFNRILRDGHAVAVDQSKFDALPSDVKLELVREEVYATALERQVIPSEYNISGTEAYMWALRKTITSFTKGWFALFIVLNLKDLYKPADNYISSHLRNKHKLIPA